MIFKHRNKKLDKYLNTPVTIEFETPQWSGTYKGYYIHNAFIRDCKGAAYVFIEKDKPKIIFFKSWVKNVWLEDGTKVYYRGK